MDDKFNDRILIGDLACLSKFSFMSIYGCSAKKYDDYINYFWSRYSHCSSLSIDKRDNKQSYLLSG